MNGDNMKQESDTIKLQEKIGYTFQNPSFLEQALTHSSYANERHLGKLACNERMEFLGDAVLELAVSEFLFKEYPDESEGKLTRKRASIVCEHTLALCANEIQLGTYLRMGKGEEVTGGRKRDSITSDALEALIGAIYLDGGFASVKEFIQAFILTDIENKELFYDSKTILQEMIQSRGREELTYRLVKEDGPDHDKTFVSEALVNGKVLGIGKGSTKKAAEQRAAYEVILSLKKEEA